MSAHTVMVAMTEPEAKRFASYAVRHNDWELVDRIEEAMKPLGLEPPMDVYCELATMRQKVRDLGGDPNA